MADSELKSNSLAARVDRFIEWTLPPAKTATLASVPVAAAGHLGPLPTLVAAAVNGSLEFCHGVVHPLAQGRAQSTSNGPAVTDSGAGDSTHSNQPVQSEQPTVASPREATQTTTPAEQTPPAPITVDKSANVNTEIGMGL